ncbi:putative Ni,Fe-hydrogenase I cytochrome b subunit [Candidatus Terasakiella magnetica]|uniref:Putative Ni,Fe-hydrogenase I cytochrome b subunit n=1 Tax=Candidatus Terasakiella magnetica TaxID=1867952 RepID=A0A1C3RI20_9PROT|nr:cytochrome b/b6 domain-containing protein [Candidatus Terasakiella magnetica]SCA56872.1 putative Ni,Fe-hydrogenase I cytochrome b subunit [Candidatus Terasakiella magnetica]
MQNVTTIWDMPVRLFHWALVICVLITLYTGFLGEEWLLNWHVSAGYLIAVFMVFRLFWGFMGSRYSRFSSFKPSLSKAWVYVQNYRKGRGDPYVGHNPAGAFFVYFVIGLLVMLSLSGFILLGGVEKQGVLAPYVSFATGLSFKVIHEALGFALLGLILLHLLGVLVHELKGEKLVLSMIHGQKSDVPEEKSDEGALRFLLFWCVLPVFVLLALYLFNQPFQQTLSTSRIYENECGDCHHAFHPSLLPQESWEHIMAGLDDHFGEDATLDEGSFLVIQDYLKANNAWKWDTEAANNLRLDLFEQPARITASPFWRYRHEAIAEEFFSHKKIESKTNCAGCHQDALVGTFYDQNINLPDVVKKGKSNE